MMKKFLALMSCVVPFGAAVAEPIVIDPANNSGANVMEGLVVPSDNYVRVVSGNGLVLGTGGLSASSLYIGLAGSGAASGQVFVEPTASANPYTIRSDGNISISSVLQVLNGYSLGIGADAQGATIDTIEIGSVDAAGALTMENVGTLNTGNITTGAALTINANSFHSSGTINSTAGDNTINVTGDMIVDYDFITDGNATTKLNVGSLSVEDFQNQTGNVTIVSGGTIASTGNFENSGTMSITGTDMTVGGTIKNDNVDGSLVMKLNSLTVNGDGTDASFENSGNLDIIVTGQTYLRNGFNLSGMQSDNTFSLHTGTLVMNGNADQLLQAFANNKLESFSLVVDSGSIAAGNIINGQSNPDANMTLSVGGDISANTIQNYGDVLNVSTIEGSAGNITINTPNGTSIYGNANSTTNIIADGVLSANGAVSNNGTMLLGGDRIELAGVSNTNDLTINARTDTEGVIRLTGGIANTAGTTVVSARQVQIGGQMSASGGSISVTGSDTNAQNLSVAGLSASGNGVINLNAWIGGINVGGDLLVSDNDTLGGGAVNFGNATQNVTVSGATNIDGNLTLSATKATGAGDVNSENGKFILTSTGQITVGGDVTATANDKARTGQLIASVIDINENLTAENQGHLILGDNASTTLTVGGDVTANDGGIIEIYSDNSTVGSLSGNGKFVMYGDGVTANVGEINVANGLWYDGTTNHDTGMVISGPSVFALRTTTTNAPSATNDITVENGMSIASGKLQVVSAHDVSVSGDVAVKGTSGALNVTAANGNIVFENGEINASDNAMVNLNGLTVETGAINVNGENAEVKVGGVNTTSVKTGDVSNAGDLTVNGGQIQMGDFTATGGTTDVVATNTTNALKIGAVNVSNGSVLLQGPTIASGAMNLTGGTTMLSSGAIDVDGDVTLAAGDLNQGGTDGGLILADSGTLSADNLAVNNGKLIVSGGDVTYNIDNGVTFAKGINVTAGNAVINAKNATIGESVVNNAGLTLNTTNDLSLGVIQNTGNLALKSSAGTISAASLTNNTGTAKITADTFTLTGALTAGDVNDMNNTSGILHQNYNGAMGIGDINIVSTNHVLSTSNLTVNGIDQVSGSMTIKSSDVTVGKNIDATNLRIQANPSADWLNVDVAGNVSGGVQFVGLEHMNIGGNYTFDNNSMIHAAILPTPGVTIDATTYNYWSTVSLADDNTLGTITNATDGNAAPLISVNGRFINKANNIGGELSNAPLVAPQIGIDIFDMVDSGTAIWLLHSNSSEGLDELAAKIRNLNVNFCNADGSKCFKYFDNSIAANAAANQTQTNLPAYLTVRDINEDGVTDSVYIVFDSRFGGPVEVFKIQPIVDRVDDHTDGEHDAAGALDDMIAGGLQDAKFNNRTPIEAIPVAFSGTNLETLATELYNRMEQYVMNRDGTPLARFSRLVQPREIEQVAGSVIMNEHIIFRDFEDHMFDEFIWNRHRSLQKAWVDVDYGLFYQNTSDDKRANGDRFSITGGYDWQYSPTLIFGLTGHVSHMSADDTDAMDLSYKIGERVDGNVKFDVADTDIGIGAYLIKILGVKTRLYGNAFLDLHLLDVSRDQNFVSHIDGSGTAFSLISEWGYLHDWLNQYIVGDLYARVGYNFGFSVKEKANGGDYMQLQSDGYMIFVPGYSLIAQKRFYPTSWFQIRPYASVGVEYDVLGAPDYAEFKFGPAKSYTKYDIEIDPLWANIGGGVELLSATGFQLGLDYRYQYNNDIQLHKVRLSGSYRF